MHTSLYTLVYIAYLYVDIGVNVCSFQLNILAGDLLGLDLDQPDPLPPETHRSVLHLLVDVVQVLGNGVVHHLQEEGGIKECPRSDSGHLVDPLEKGTASLCCGRVAVQGMLVPLRCLQRTFVKIGGYDQNVLNHRISFCLVKNFTIHTHTITPTSYLGVSGLERVS